LHKNIKTHLANEQALRRDLHSSGILRSADWWFVFDISGQPIGSIFEGQTLREVFLDCLTLEDGTDGLSRNVVNKLPIYAVWHRRRAQISFTLAEAWNHAVYSDKNAQRV